MRLQMKTINWNDWGDYRSQEECMQMMEYILNEIIPTDDMKHLVEFRVV